MRLAHMAGDIARYYNSDHQEARRTGRGTFGSFLVRRRKSKSTNAFLLFAG